MRIFICLLHASAANTCARAANACIFSLYPFDHVFAAAAAAAFDYNLGLDFILYCIGVVVCSRRRVIEFSGAISLLAHFSFFFLSSPVLPQWKTLVLRDTFVTKSPR